MIYDAKFKTFGCGSVCGPRKDTAGLRICHQVKIFTVRGLWASESMEVERGFALWESVHIGPRASASPQAIASSSLTTEMIIGKSVWVSSVVTSRQLDFRDPILLPRKGPEV